MSNKHHIIPVFVPHKGCPHDCVFCNQKKITGLSTDITDTHVEDVIEEYIKTIPTSNQILEIAFFGGSFTGIEKEVQRKLLTVANKYKEKGVVNYIRLSTRPDYISEDILKLLQENGVDIIELGVQSLDEDVLQESHRGHSIHDVYKASKLIKEYNFKLGLQMMVGLPGDSKEKSISTARKIADIAPKFVRVYPTLVIKDTYLEKMYIDGSYIPLSIEKTVDICCDILMIFRYNRISVIRLGLQPTENVTYGQDVVAGPFHPSIRQLVESKIYQKIFIEFFKDIRYQIDEITLRVNKKEISNIVGHKSSNVEFIKKKYNLKKVKVLLDDIPREYFFIEINGNNEKVELNKYIEQYLVNNNLKKITL